MTYSSRPGRPEPMLRPPTSSGPPSRRTPQPPARPDRRRPPQDRTARRRPRHEAVTIAQPEPPKGCASRWPRARGRASPSEDIEPAEQRGAVLVRVDVVEPHGQEV